MQIQKSKFSLFLLLILSSALPLHAQQSFRTTKANVIGFMEYLPKDYANNSDKYPVVIFLHGLGERGANSTSPATIESTMPAVLRNGPPKHVQAGTQFPFILISPQLKNNYGTWPGWYVLEVIDYVKTYLRIDEKRIHITGLSLGGGGTFTMAQEHSRLFASASPICGFGSTNTACNVAKENMPLWAFHGDADGTVALSRSTTMVNAINACSPSPRALLTIYPGVGHNSWERAYTPNHSFHKPNIYDWMMNQTNTVNAGNRIPTANAGSDITTSATTLTINGAGTDADGSITAYQWTKISGPAVTLSNANTKSLALAGMANGTYIFKLLVRDNSGNTDSDYVRVTKGASTNPSTPAPVTPAPVPVAPPPANRPPVVDAGVDRTITLPTNSIVITGTATDADGSVVSYSWAKVSGGAANLSGANTDKLSLSGLVAGKYVFRLTVKDNQGASNYNDMELTVLASTAANKPPVADAGPDIIIKLPTNTVTLNGIGRDPDGSIASYAWTKISGGAAGLSGVNSPTLTVSGLAQGNYVLRLTVTDNAGAIHFDNMLIRVDAATASQTPAKPVAPAPTPAPKPTPAPVVSAPKPAPVVVTPPPTNTVANKKPIADAGKDLSINLPKNNTIIYGSGKDPDGRIVSYRWVKDQGGPATLSGANTPTLNVSGLSVGWYIFTLIVTDDKGATAQDRMGISVKK